MLNISKTAYYTYRNGTTFTPSDSNLAMTTAVDKIFWENSRRYGSRRVLEALKKQGVKAGRHRVRRLMQEQDWRAIQPRSFVPKTTNSKHGLTACPNRLIEFGKPTASNQAWVGDITYLPLADGHWAYLASWMDLFSSRIVGWWVDKHMKESLIVQAFDQAILQRQPKPGLIVHSDRGGQYFGHSFRQRLAKWGCRQSMAEADNPYQNAHAESFWGRLKTELLEDGCFMTLQDARSELFNYIEGYYNVRRLHSALDYRSPIDFENQFYQTNQLNSQK